MLLACWMLLSGHCLFFLVILCFSTASITITQSSTPASFLIDLPHFSPFPSEIQKFTLTVFVVHPLEFHVPGWHDAGHLPVVDDCNIDRSTGAVFDAPEGAGHQEDTDPPAVDIVVMSVHENTTQCVFLGARPFPMAALLGHIVTNVIGKRKLEIDSVTATPFAIRVILAHPLTPTAFSEIAMEMANGIWDHAAG
jgi:hypothetical protein